MEVTCSLSGCGEIKESLPLYRSTDVILSSRPPFREYDQWPVYSATTCLSLSLWISVWTSPDCRLSETDLIGDIEAFATSNDPLSFLPFLSCPMVCGPTIPRGGSLKLFYALQYHCRYNPTNESWGKESFLCFRKLNWEALHFHSIFRTGLKLVRWMWHWALKTPIKLMSIYRAIRQKIVGKVVCLNRAIKWRQRSEFNVLKKVFHATNSYWVFVYTIFSAYTFIAFKYIWVFWMLWKAKTSLSNCKTVSMRCR